MSFFDTDSYDICAARRGLLEGIPFLLVERRAPVNKELFRRFAVLILECFEHLGNQFFRFGCLEVELEITGFPRAIRAPEDDSVPLIKKHLPRATGVRPCVVRYHLEGK